MNCEKFLTVAADLARNQMMDANDRASAQMHVDKCHDCGRAWNDQIELSERLRRIADVTTSSQAPEHVEAQVLAAFREQTRSRSIQFAPRWRYWMSAAAAVVLIGFGLIAWRWQVASQQHQPAQASSNSATAPPTTSLKQEQTPTVTAGANATATQTLNRPAPKRSLSRRRATPFQLAKDDGAKQSTVEPVLPATNIEVKELSTKFFPVGYGSALDLQDGGQLLRVDLPRSALGRFGLPMNMDRADERIKADVLVGTDGLARAIRFVETKAINKD